MDETLGLDRDKFKALPKETWTSRNATNHARLHSALIRILLFYQARSLTVKTSESLVIRCKLAIQVWRMVVSEEDS